MWEAADGGMEQHGTCDMTGNMAASRVFRGGSASFNEDTLRSSTRLSNGPTAENNIVGSAIPEPSSIAMVGVACGLGLLIRKKSRL